MAVTADGGQQLMARRSGPMAALQTLSEMPVLKQIGVMAGLALSVALGVWVVQWSRAPGYSVLYGNLAPREASEVVAGLERAGVPHRLDAQSGAVLVPGGDVHRARMALAAEGLPQSADLGFELLQREPEMGTSQFLEQARYQRALEVELGRSVATIHGVEKARVHLALPKASAFVRERKRVSASVLLNLYAGRSLEPSQVAAIANLVAASVPGMEVADVRVVDQKGRLLTASEQSRDAQVSQQEFDYARRLEGYYIKRIEDILSPILGPDGVRAQVVADVDFTRTEQTRESFGPDQAVLRSEQVAEESRAPGGLGSGIPGALSNTPPGTGVAPEQAAGPARGASGQGAAGAAEGRGPTAGQPGSAPGGAGGGATAGGQAAQGNLLSRRHTRNFEIDRTVSHTTLPTTTLKRLSVAVVLDDLRTPGEDGQVTRRSLKPEELDRFIGLVREAIGFNAERGDSVNVVNVPFTGGVAAEGYEEASVWQQSWVWEVGKQALGVGLVLVLVFGVLRPTMRRLASQAPVMAPPPALAGPRGASVRASEVGLDDDRLSLSEGQAGSPRIPGGVSKDRQVQQVESLRSLVGQDPKRVAQVVRNWISENE
ncbi:MAG: flagellar M-ring protein FliF [Gammaproteobacteria bacterium]|jgi:flagellar M-ring protein FliF|nr:flagellar M-ring protein FliF [Gammaproteobacteria bacterium]